MNRKNLILIFILILVSHGKVTAGRSFLELSAHQGKIEWKLPPPGATSSGSSEFVISYGRYLKNSYGLKAGIGLRMERQTNPFTGYWPRSDYEVLVCAVPLGMFRELQILPKLHISAMLGLESRLLLYAARIDHYDQEVLPHTIRDYFPKYSVSPVLDIQMSFGNTLPIAISYKLTNNFSTVENDISRLEVGSKLQETAILSIIGLGVLWSF